MIISFIGFLLLFTLIGISSAWKSRGTKQDYYVASNSVKAWLVGLSAVATNNSGYMFIGVIGYTYATGLASIWLMIGWIVGDFLGSLLVHSRLRAVTSRSGEVSYAGVLSNWYGNGSSAIQRLIGVISLIFLMAYAGAQLIAGGKALNVLFDWPLWAGAVLGAVMVAIYCFAGGIRASIWTDAAQSIVMILAMGVMLFISIQTFGGIDGSISRLQQIDHYLDLFPRDLVFPGLAGGVLFAVSWLFAGLSVIGQPHVMVRFMTLENANKMRAARTWYYLWYILFYCMATGVGLLSRIYLPDSASFDAELALPTMAMELLPPVLVGLVLAGIFAATMSTADSLVLSCSAALTHDVLPQRIEHTLILKAATILITFFALVWALSSSQSVFSLVIMSWSGLASAFAPLLLALCLGMKPSNKLTVIAILSGLGVAILWRIFGLHNAVYEGLPGILSGFLVLCTSLIFNPQTTKSEARGSLA